MCARQFNEAINRSYGELVAANTLTRVNGDPIEVYKGLLGLPSLARMVTSIANGLGNRFSSTANSPDLNETQAENAKEVARHYWRAARAARELQRALDNAADAYAELSKSIPSRRDARVKL